MPANIHFLRKIASDELRETLYFATGITTEKVRTPNFTTLKAGVFNVKIISNRNIVVNGDKCRSINEAKYLIQEYSGDY